MLVLNFVVLAALIFNSFLPLAVSLVSVSVVEAGGYTVDVSVGTFPLDVVLVLSVIVFRPVNVDETLVILNLVMLIFNSFPELSLAVVNPDESTIVVSVNSLPDGMLVLGFLVVFAVNGALL